MIRRNYDKTFHSSKAKEYLILNVYLAWLEPSKNHNGLQRVIDKDKSRPS